MNVDSAYLSSISEHAREEDITKKHGAGLGKVVKNYYLGRSYIGRRVYDGEGRLEHEASYKNGKRHGWEYRWKDGRLASATPYDNGREHGTAYQWGRSGALLGAYTMNQGTGIDLWWIELEDTPQLSEARVVVDNQMEGYEYWFEWHTPGALWKERWWFRGKLHGIEREWNRQGKLRRGFPKYWIHGEQVEKRKYIRAEKSDSTLRPFYVEDNLRARVFPLEIADYLPGREAYTLAPRETGA